jgi:glycosyltransferase involved in cell wall biosynthesis
MPLSLAVITYNEEENIVRLLSSLADTADEIIIVDSFSTDKTKEICAQYPQIKFFEKKFNGYGEQKNPEKIYTEDRFFSKHRIQCI